VRIGDEENQQDVRFIVISSPSCKVGRNWKRTKILRVRLQKGFKAGRREGSNEAHVDNGDAQEQALLL
jgi:hypothetical protein